MSKKRKTKEEAPPQEDASEESAPEATSDDALDAVDGDEDESPLGVLKTLGKVIKEEGPEENLRSSPPIGLRQWWATPSLSGDGLDDRQIQFGVLAISILVYMTQLGFGLWDCWEPHYAETARMMVVRNDWMHPFWSYAYLLSKPILMFWYMAASMSVFGVTEWAIRLPFALHAVLLIWVVYFVTSRLFSSRAGLLAALVVGTSPLTTFLGRQALADILVATYMTSALGFFALAIFGHRNTRETAAKNGFEVPVHLPYIYFAYAMLGLGMLAKGLLGPGLPVIVVAGYILMSWDWRIILRARLVTGTLLMCLIGLPWYLHMITFKGRNIDDEYLFVKRFLLNDNVKRLFAGVHGDRGHFVYFVKQLGYASGMWIGFLPLGIANAARFRKNAPDANEKLWRFLFSWWLIIFLFFSFSQTKFHHYIYPLIPISAILIGLWLDRYLSLEDVERGAVQRFGLLVALGVFGLVIRDVVNNPKHLVNMFVYMYSRPYPTADPMYLGGQVWQLGGTVFKGVFRPTPQTFFSLFASVVAAFMLSGYFYNARRYVVRGLAGIAILWTVYHAHVFMIKLTPHWSQEPLFAYMKQDSALWKKLLSRKNGFSNALNEPVPAEPLIAFKMNWRGEKFYSGNRDLQVMKTYSYTRLYNTIKRYQKPRRPVYFIIEVGRLKKLKKGVGTYNERRLRIPDLSPRYRRVGKRRVKLDPRKAKKVRWTKPTKNAVSWFKRYHNKYLIVKLLPRPPQERQTKWQLDRDKKRRARDDQFRTRWYYSSATKRWRKRGWWIREERRRKRARAAKARRKRLNNAHRRDQLRRKLRRWRQKYRQRQRLSSRNPAPRVPKLRIPAPRLPLRRPAVRPPLVSPPLVTPSPASRPALRRKAPPASRPR